MVVECRQPMFEVGYKACWRGCLCEKASLTACSFTTSVCFTAYIRQALRMPRTKHRVRLAHNANIANYFISCMICLLEVEILREFGIKHNRYANCCVALVGEIVIRLLALSCSKGMLSYPECTN